MALTGFTRSQKKMILATALVVAWMWSLPLLGHLQVPVPLFFGIEGTITLTFLIGSVLGYVFFAQEYFEKFRRAMGVYAPLGVFAALSFLMVNSWLSGPYVSLLSAGLTLVMGACTAPLFSAWGVSISGVAVEFRGRYVGSMLLTASIISILMGFFGRIFPTLSLIAGSGVLLMAFGLLKFSDCLEPASKEVHRKRPDVSFKDYKWKMALFLLFGIVLLSFYSLSWISHQTMLSPQGDSFAASVLGPLLYGVVALAGGAVYDHLDEIEAIGIVGLAILLSAYIMVPVGAELNLGFLPNLAVEAGYGVLDLFVFIFLFQAVQVMGLSFYKCYAYGLAYNAAVVASGYIWGMQIAADTAIPLIVSASLVIGVVSSLGLRGIRLMLQSETSDDNPETAEVLPDFEEGSVQIV